MLRVSRVCNRGAQGFDSLPYIHIRIPYAISHPKVMHTEFRTLIYNFYSSFHFLFHYPYIPFITLYNPYITPPPPSPRGIRPAMCQPSLGRRWDRGIRVQVYGYIISYYLIVYYDILQYIMVDYDTKII